MRKDSLITTPLRLKIATLVVPPPKSTTMDPFESAISRPAPMAAAKGSSMTTIFRAPACNTASMTARRSTFVTPDGTDTMTRGLLSI